MAGGRRIKMRRGGKTLSVEVVNNIPRAIDQLRKLTSKSDDELLTHLAVGACEVAASSAGGAPKAKLSGVLGSAYDPKKGGKTKKGRLYFALMSKKGRRGTPVSEALQGKTKRYGREQLGWSRKRSASGFGRFGFLGAREHVRKAAASRGVKVSPTRSKNAIKTSKSSDASVRFRDIQKSITIVNSTSSATSNSQHSKFQAALIQGLRINLTRYLVNARLRYAKIAKQVSAR